ncbi:Zinc finger protein [Heracleum sosnowskyi]|uniref:Zinc finger protein n=1 Tax=Heracleum sosnowskyi TaxID=360622 RepID=A0AAD8J7I6_9APIA|nr:Zinc finger protein [Heracleum sosnowskyi]
MSSPVKNNRRIHDDKAKKLKLSDKASSFHGRTPETMAVAKLHRPRTVPDLLAGRRLAGVSSPEVKPAKLTKLLLNVTVQRSLGPVMVIMSLESTVGELIAAVLRQYAKEGRRPIIDTNNTAAFDLHYSQFSLESLERGEKLIDLGSRNFFMCGGGGVTTATATCWKEAEKGATKNGWLKFMDFLF